MFHATGFPREVRPRFSGHETFPFRYDWLRKYVGQEPVEFAAPASEQLLEREMVRFGVGKNMVRSMRHWAFAVGVARDDGECTEPTDFGKWFLGHDPYLEELGTIWALHWRIARNADLATTWFWFFNLYPSLTVDTRTAADDLEKVVAAQGWRAIARGTLQRDVECFVRSYAVSRGRRGELTEDSLECPLAELELLRPTADRRQLEFQIGPKPSLPDTVFAFALAEFFAAGSAKEVGLELITHAPGSPGRIFKLDEGAVADRLARIEATSGGAFRWIETAGLQQVQLVQDGVDPLSFLTRAIRSAQ